MPYFFFVQKGTIFVSRKVRKVEKGVLGFVTQPKHIMIINNG